MLHRPKHLSGGWKVIGEMAIAIVSRRGFRCPLTVFTVSLVEKPHCDNRAGSAQRSGTPGEVPHALALEKPCPRVRPGAVGCVPACPGGGGKEYQCERRHLYDRLRPGADRVAQ